MTNIFNDPDICYPDCSRHIKHLISIAWAVKGLVLLSCHKIWCWKFIVYLTVNLSTYTEHSVWYILDSTTSKHVETTSSLSLCLITIRKIFKQTIPQHAITLCTMPPPLCGLETTQVSSQQLKITYSDYIRKNVKS